MRLPNRLQSSLRATLALLAAGATLTLLAPSATAASLGETCESTEECDQGLSCEVVGATGCACAAPSPGSPDGDSFAPPPPPECDCPEPEELKACVPGPCTSNEDCGEGLVCATWEEPCMTRPAVPCSSEDPENCGAPEPGGDDTCTPTSYSVCAPPWVLPCEAASDCGEGFTCEASETCVCSGGGATPTDPSIPPAPDGGGSGSGDGNDSSGDREAPPYEEPDCACAPSDEKYCRPVQVECDSNEDCPSGWSCFAAGGWDDAPCAMPEPQGDGASPPDCAPAREEASSVGYCAPLGWGGWYGAGDDRGTGSGEATNTPQPQTPTGPADPDAPNDGGAGLPGSTNQPAQASGGACSSGGLAGGLALLGALLLLVVRRGRRIAA